MIKLFVPYACELGNKQIVELLIEILKGDYDLDNAFLSACESGNKHLVDLLVLKGAKIFQKALNHSCRSGNKEIVELINSKSNFFFKKQNLFYFLYFGC